MVRSMSHNGGLIEYRMTKLQEKGKGGRRVVFQYAGHQFDTLRQFIKFLNTGVVKDNAH